MENFEDDEKSDDVDEATINTLDHTDKWDPSKLRGELVSELPGELPS